MSRQPHCFSEEGCTPARTVAREVPKEDRDHYRSFPHSLVRTREFWLCSEILDGAPTALAEPGGASLFRALGNTGTLWLRNVRVGFSPKFRNSMVLKERCYKDRCKGQFNFETPIYGPRQG